MRECWANTGAEPDEETRAIDALEDSLGPLDGNTLHIRRLTGTLEMCHHKAERHVEIIIEAIGAGRTAKAKGRREPGSVPPREMEYQALIEALSAWCQGSPPDAHARVAGYRGNDFVALLGEPTPLKIWQAKRVIEKIVRFLDPERRWKDAYDNVIDIDHAGEEAEFRDRTKNTVIHDTVDGQPAEITLAAAIDNITGCSWDLVETIRTILGAIGGELHPGRPLALHARNIRSNPVRRRMRVVCDTLEAFCEGRAPRAQVGESILRTLGEKAPVKHWLAASLDKTIRLQFGI